MIADKAKFDIVVIGAGPAGSIAARYAAEKGASVLILERDREPGIPVRCAEGVSHNGLIQFIEPDPKWIATNIDGARLYSPNGKYIEMFNNGKGYVLDRRLFDSALCDLACQKGAFLLPKADALSLIYNDKRVVGVQYRSLDKIKTVFCDIVIGADGVESKVGRWAGIDTFIAPEDIDTCVQYTTNNLDLPDNICQFFFGTDVAPGGYIWIFPKSKKTANIGIGISGHLAQPGRGPKYYLDHFMQKNFPQATVNSIVYGGVPTFAGHEFVTDGVLLAGDAARQVNPITGGGVIQGMIGGALCGKIAGDAILKKNYSKKFLKTYEKEWDKVLGSNQRFIYKLKARFMKMTDQKFNSMVEMCSRIPQNKFDIFALFKEAVKEDPMLLAEMAKSYVVSKFIRV